jgi:hypothetical protein
MTTNIVEFAPALLRGASKQRGSIVKLPGAVITTELTG